MIIKYFVVSCIFYGEKRTLIFIYIYIDDNVLEGLNGKPTGEPISKKSEKTHGFFSWSAEHYYSAQFAGKFKMATHGFRLRNSF